MRAPRAWTALICLCLAMVSLGPAPARSAPDAAPTWVNYGNRLALSLGGGEVYYTTDHSGDDAITCAGNPGAYQYGRMSGPFLHQVLQSGCSAPQAGDLAPDATHLYYTAGPFGVRKAYRQPVGGGSPEQLLGGATVQSPVAVDGTHAYFVMTSAATAGTTLVKVRKSDKVQQTVAQLPAGARVNDLALDAAFVYWTEGTELTAGAVRAVSKNGGNIFTAAEAGVELAYDILVDGDYVYWSELGGRVRRRLKVNGTAETLHDGDDPVYGITVDGSTLYFAMGTSNGSIWRMPKAGGAETLMTFDRHTPGPLAVLSERLFWAEGSVYYLDKTAASAGVDYVLDHLEVTQGLQDGANSIPMVSNKATYVRVYGHEAQGAAERKLNAWLYGYDVRGNPLRGSPLQPLQKVDVDADGAKRAEPEQSFVFLLPSDWTQAGYQLQAEVNPNDGKRGFELNYANNRYPVAPQSFAVSQRVACVNVYPAATVGLEDQTLTPDFDSDLLPRSMERAEALLPAELWSYPQADTLYKDPENKTPYDLTLEDDRGALMETLAGFFDLSDPPAGCAVKGTAYAAFVHGDSDTYDPVEKFLFGGEGRASTQSMWSIMWDKTDHQSFNQPRGAVTIAHEIGHVFGRAHVACGSAKNTDPAYPYDPCYLDDSDDEDAFWGFDGISQVAIDPIVAKADPDIGAGDLLSYRKNRWPSDYTWMGVYDAIGATGGGLMGYAGGDGALLGAQAAGDALWIRGVIDTRGTTPTAILLPAVQQIRGTLSARQEQQLEESQLLLGADTTYAIELVDAAGGVLRTQPFVPENDTESPDDPLFWLHLTMPAVDGTARIRLVVRSPHQVLAEREVTPATPTVQFVGSPHVDSTGKLVVSWAGQDGDGDPLWYYLQLQGADGRRTALVVDGRASSATVPAPYTGNTTVNAGTLLLRATDGVNTSAVVSATITLPDHAPQAAITAPLGGAELPAETQVLLRGRGWDAEDGQLPDSALTWYVDGVLAGTGRWLAVDGLGVGGHVARLVVKDSDESSTETTTHFTVGVGFRAYLPSVDR